MGGVAKAVTNIVKDSIDVVNDVIVKPIYDVAVKIPLDTAQAIVEGKSLKKSLAESIKTVAGDIANIYDRVGNKWLGINDDGFLGIKGGIFSKMGQFMQDLLKDHVVTTVGIGIAVAALVVSIFFPPAYSLATAAVVAATSVGITSTILIMGVWYVTLGIISLGISFLASTIIDAAVIAMYGDYIFGTLEYYENIKETIRIANLAAILDGSIYDKMAGGWMYASQFAGDVYYDAAKVGNCNISVGGEFSLTPHAIQINFGYVDTTLKNIAGEDNFSVVSMNI